MDYCHITHTVKPALLPPHTLKHGTFNHNGTLTGRFPALAIAAPSAVKTPAEQAQVLRTPYTNAYATDDGRLMVEVGRNSFVCEATATRHGIVTAAQRASVEAKAARLPARKTRRDLAREAKTRAILKALIRSL